jgi:hypothetical protein
MQLEEEWSSSVDGYVKDGLVLQLLRLCLLYIRGMNHTLLLRKSHPQFQQLQSLKHGCGSITKFSA